MSLHNQNVLGTDIATAELQDGAVTAVKLATDAVETAKIKNANVTIDKVPQTGRAALYNLRVNAGNTELEFGLASVDPASDMTIGTTTKTIQQWILSGI